MVKNNIRSIALYGKGGIGKSTIASNLSVALKEVGEVVLQIGCSPKIDSTSQLNNGEILDLNILEHTREKGQSKEVVKECIYTCNEILCAESGGPEPAKGCAGKGVKIAVDLLHEYNLIEESGATFVIFDVIGDIVCGGFAQPMRAGFAQELYLVSSGELMSLYSSNNICHAVTAAISEGSEIRVGGIIGNMRGVPMEREVLDEFGKVINVPILSYIPRSDIVQEAEGDGGTVLEKRPESEQAQRYRDLAKTVLETRESLIPTPVELEDLMEMLRRYQAKDYLLT